MGNFREVEEGRGRCIRGKCKENWEEGGVPWWREKGGRGSWLERGEEELERG